MRAIFPSSSAGGYHCDPAVRQLPAEPGRLAPPARRLWRLDGRAREHRSGRLRLRGLSFLSGCNAFDAYSGDYGTGFFDHAFASASYLVEHPLFGWLAFGGDLRHEGGLLRLTPKDSFAMRCFIAPAGVWLTLDAGRFERVEYDPEARRLTVVLAPGDAFTPRAWLNVETTIEGTPGWRPAGEVRAERGAWPIEFGKEPVGIDLVPDR